MANATAHALTESPSDDWDFRGADTKTLTHCFHSYPAMMIPQVAARLIDWYGRGARLVLDPYCGTGTSLVEANVQGIDAVGADLNPLARLVATAKTDCPPPDELDARLHDIRGALLFGGDAMPRAALPPINNLDFWFSTAVQEKLAAIKLYIDQIENDSVRRFFQVAFSETVRECSNTRNGEFKLYRMSEPQLEKFQPEVFALFGGKLERNRVGLAQFIAKNKSARTVIFDFNSVTDIPHAAVAPQSVDIVITSPPYGDSATTVAYGQFSRLANEWLRFESASAVDRSLMGGKKAREVFSFGEPRLDAAIANIGEHDCRRALDVCAFYRDYRDSINNVSATVKRGGYACYVVGNRKVKGVTLPTDRATKFFFAQNGFTCEQIYTRNIPNKRMPSRNSPSNVSGKTDVTMCREYIVVMKKRVQCHAHPAN